MKNPLRAAAAAAALAAALAAPASARAQQQRQPRLGLGVSVNTNVVTPLTTATAPAGTARVFAPPGNLYVPIYVAPNVRIEPQVGWLTVTDDDTSADDSSFAAGIGALVLKPVAAAASLYGGVRLVSTWLKDEELNGGRTVFTKRTRRNTMLAAVFGGEYLPAPWFSAGIEAQLEYTAIGDVKVQETAQPTQTLQGGSARSIEALLFLRVYFL